jgi:hypothetical protein
MLGCCSNMTSDIALLNETIMDLNHLTLTQISSRLDAIAANLSTHDTGAMARLAGISTSLSAFESEMGVRMLEVETVLSNLTKLDQVLTDLGSLAASIDAAQVQVVKSIEDSNGEIDAKLDTTQLLLGAVLAIGVVSLLLSIDARRRVGARSKTKEYKASKDQTSEKPRN